MLKLLSYLNITFAFIYFLLYLQNGSYYAIAGLIGVLLFNWQTLISIERAVYRWALFQYLTGILTLTVSGFLLYSGVNSILYSLQNDYYGMDQVLLFTYSLVFGTTIALHFLLMLIRNLRKNSE